ncbi:MAG TPA: tRNA pseudouridine(55) synthase TruB [Pedococcus sp.]|nr:tRNA pseudouridine(55) synthase TruB [Pedococcus sp.]
MPAPDGLLVVDKPAGWTSHDVVGRARRLCGTRKVGHAGTLDPMATGVLVLGIGRATRLLTFLVGCDKEYIATIRLGQTTVTDDAEGEVTSSTPVEGLSDDAIAAALATLTGAIDQVPSAVSAIKVNGERAYHRVRAGESVELTARRVTVSRFVVVARRDGDAIPGIPGMPGMPVVDLDVEVTVSSGTYVRALARDLGRELGVGGHLTALRRTRVGAFTLDGAHGLEDLGLLSGPEAMPVLQLAEAARSQFAVRELSAEESTAVGYGQRVDSLEAGRTDPVAAFAPDGRLVAMLDESGHKAKAHVVFAPAGS